MSSELSPCSGCAPFPSLGKGGEPWLTGERGEFSGAITTSIRVLTPPKESSDKMGHYRNPCTLAFALKNFYSCEHEGHYSDSQVRVLWNSSPTVLHSAATVS